MIRAMRLIGLNATTMPGKTALFFAPDVVRYLSAGRHITLITGTNGKTTTARILGSIYESAGYEVLNNTSGANLLSGIATTLIEKSSLRKTGPKIKIILEMDEGAFSKHSDKLSPECIIVTNLFRDQLDRYGELTRTREMISEGIKRVPNAKVAACADDSLLASIFHKEKRKVYFFGINASTHVLDITNVKSITSEAGNCVFCGNKYEYTLNTYGHLGIYKCSNCGFSRPDPDISFAYEHTGNNFYKVDIYHKGTSVIEADLPIAGEHNVYNAAAAVTAAIALSVPYDRIKSGVLNSSSGFGRMEKFEIGGREVCIVLIKNPAGFDRALSFISKAEDIGGIQFLLNDKIADGTDVSWIWDVEIDPSRIPLPCYVSGTRAYDMALRFKYSGIREEDILVDPDPSSSFEEALKGCEVDKCLYIFPNYTSLLELRGYLEKKYRLKGIWE